MDYEERKRKQRIRVLIAEFGMVVSALLLVVVATLSAMGFFISSNGQIEQSGLAQIHSIPTGASVTLDGSTLFSRTNLSRTMPAGKHYLKLSRTGYDTWEKDITMRSGVLMRIYYPRLFLQDRTIDEVLQLTKPSDSPQTLEFYSPSTSRNYILYAQQDSTSWQLIDIRNDEIRRTELDLSDILPQVTKYTPNANHQVTPVPTFDGEILDLRWSANDEYILAKIKTSEQVQWLLINLRNINNSLNLTKVFSLNFDQIEYIDDTANQLFVLENHHLRKINTSNQSVSKVLLDHIETFENYQNNLIYLTTSSDDLAHTRSVGIYKDGEAGTTTLATFNNNAKIYISLGNYYGDDYICYVVDNKPTILYGTLPSYSEKGADLSQLKQLASELTYSTIPSHVEISQNNEFLLAYKDSQIMVIDLDAGELYEYNSIGQPFYWLDSSMFYAFKDSQLYVWDYDGTNQRNLSQSLQSIAVQQTILKSAKLFRLDSINQYHSIYNTHASIIQQYQFVITPNDRWLYYLSQDDNSVQLTREKLRD